jgi:competence protein ComEA
MKKVVSLCLLSALVLTCLAVSGWAQTGKSIAARTASKAAAVKPALVDINSATKEDLEKLPGIGNAYSEKIIKGRPYAKKDQLVSRNIIPQATYDKIKDLIIASKK